MAKSGRWNHLKGKLEKFVLNADKPKWLLRVQEAKQKYVGLDKAGAARQFKLERAEKKRLEGLVKAQNVELEALGQLIVEQLEAETVQKVGLDSGETVYLKTEPYTSVTDYALVIAWLKRNRMEKMLTVNYRTLSSLTKDRLEAGKAPLPGTKVLLKTSASVTGGPKAKEGGDDDDDGGSDEE